MEIWPRNKDQTFALLCPNNRTFRVTEVKYKQHRIEEYLRRSYFLLCLQIFNIINDDVIVNNNFDWENKIENVWAASINRADKFQSHPDTQRWIFVKNLLNSNNKYLDAVTV